MKHELTEIIEGILESGISEDNGYLHMRTLDDLIERPDFQKSELDTMIKIYVLKAWRHLFKWEWTEAETTLRDILNFEK